MFVTAFSDTFETATKRSKDNSFLFILNDQAHFFMSCLRYGSKNQSLQCSLSLYKSSTEITTGGSTTGGFTNGGSTTAESTTGGSTTISTITTTLITSMTTIVSYMI